MPENNKTEDFLKKLAPCIERGELEKCVEEAVRLAEEMGIGAIKLSFLSCQMGESEKHGFAYTLALATAPNLKWAEKAKAYSNAGLAAQYLNKLKKAEDCYKLAIESDPKFATAYYNYAVLLKELGRREEAEEHYLKTIELDPKDFKSQSNYAVLLKELGRKKEAEEHYLKAIELNPNDVNAYSNYANLLEELGKKKEAEKQYLRAIEIDKELAEPHHNYAILLIGLNRKSEAEKEAEFAFNIFKKTRRATEFHLSRAYFYHASSEKNFNRKRFNESADDAGKAADEYLKAAETADGALKDNFSQQGNILKAKSFVRKVPKKSCLRKILYRFGKNPDITDIINNLKEAALYYEKAAMCPIEERKDECGACYISISVFSETLSTMESVINGREPEINKKEWISKLDGARRIYKKKEMENGIALVDTLKQLIQCIDKMAVYTSVGLKGQKEECGRCFSELIKVSGKLDGALSVLATHSIEVIREYAKQHGMAGFPPEETKKSFVDYIKILGKIIGYIVALIVGIIAILQFLQMDTRTLEFIKNMFNQTLP
jgi:tetratricopeptide (TPR) repeat protein